MILVFRQNKRAVTLHVRIGLQQEGDTNLETIFHRAFPFELHSNSAEKLLKMKNAGKYWVCATPSFIEVVSSGSAKHYFLNWTIKIIKQLTEIFQNYLLFTWEKMNFQKHLNIGLRLIIFTEVYAYFIIKEMPLIYVFRCPMKQKVTPCHLMSRWTGIVVSSGL